MALPKNDRWLIFKQNFYFKARKKMHRTIALCLIAVGCCADWTLAADPLDVGNAMTAFKEAYPEVQTFRTGARISRLYGSVFGYGSSAEDTAEQFRLTHAQALGVAADELSEVGPLADGRHTQELMLDRATGEFKFTLVYYTQVKDGVPVFRSDLRLLVRNEADYPLVLASSSVRDLGNFEIQPAARAQLDREGHVQEQFEFGQENASELIPAVHVFTAPRVVVWAGVDGVKAAEPRLAMEFIASDGDPSELVNEKWLLLTDLQTGEVLYREDLLLEADVTGSVGGFATQGSGAEQCGSQVAVALPYARVTIGGTTAFADGNGSYIIDGGTGSVTVDSLVRGLFFVVNNLGGSNSLLSQVVTAPATVDFLHNSGNTEFTLGEVNAYLHANFIRDFVLSINPLFPAIGGQGEFSITVNESSAGGFCPGNAQYQGTNLRFCAAGGGSPNTAWSSVVYHEYGHHLVAMAGSGQDQYGEGYGDVISNVIFDESGTGFGFFGACGTPLREADNTMQYPCSGEVHLCGTLFSGCNWSLRQELIVTEPANYQTIMADLVVNSVLLHSGSNIGPDITIDYLTLDDDDGDLGNGTPHSVEIEAAFDAHNMLPPPPPLNDDCADAIAVCPGTVFGHTIGVNNDGSANCADSAASPDVWYTYTPGLDGVATIETCGAGTNYDGAISVHTGACPGTGGTEIACDDDGCGTTGGPSSVTINVSAGVTYLIRVSGWQGSSGNFELSVSGPICASTVLNITFPNGLPSSLEPGVPTTLDVDIQDGTESLSPGTAMLNYRYDLGSFVQAALTPLGGSLFEATFPPPACSDSVEFYISADGDLGSTMFSPADAPTSVHTAVVGITSPLLSDDFEADLGWTAGVVGDNATTGVWTRVDPNGTAAQTEDDHTASGTQCFVTGQGAVGGALGANDVDGGTTTLLSPIFDASTGQTSVSYWRWYSNTTGGAPNADIFEVDISNNGGSSWVNAETVGPTGTGTSGGWIFHEFLVDVILASTNNMQVRFVASDLGTGSIVEAAVDDFEVNATNCIDADPPVILDAVSRVTHGGAGSFDAPMSAGTIIETRQSGVETLVVTFDASMDVGTAVAANISAIGLNNGAYAGTIGASLSGANDVLTITFIPALIDVDRYTINLAGMSSDTGVAIVDGTFEVVALQGDISTDLIVSTGDASIIKPNFGVAVDGTNFRFDFNADGVISTGDASIVKPLFGNTAP